MQIKVYRGTHQIGGCITEIKTSTARIIIDMGSELPSANQSASDIEIDGVTRGTPNCDAVLITHYHGDHIGMVEKVLPEIPIYMGQIAKQIYSVVQQTLKNKLDKGNPEQVKNFREYTIGKPMIFGDITVTPYVVDHSAFDAYMLLVEAEGKRILHTGDFRLHGARGNKMPIVFEKYAKDIDILITEGTMLSRNSEKVITEHELGAQAKTLLSEYKNVFVLCSSTNIDTIAEFYNAAIECNKPFIVCEDDFQAEILRIVAQSTSSSFYDFSKRKVYSYGTNLHSLMSKQGFCFIGRTNYLTKKAIETFSNSLLIYSMWKGYLDKKHAAFDEFKSEFIDYAINMGCRLEFLHTSGHASTNDIKRICEITQAKTIIPIHCEQPENFANITKCCNVKVLHDGEIFTV